jgi:hypothetical protein
MKYICTLIMTAIFSAAFAQPVLTGAWVPQVGLQFYQIGYDGSDGISQGPAGANQTWDFSGFDTIGYQSVSYIAPASAPSGSSFAGAANCQLVTEGPDTTYTFNALNGNAYQTIGIISIGAASYTASYTGPLDNMQFPATIDSGFIATGYLSGLYSGATLRGASYDTVMVDAYGTLITDAGTFANVLRYHVIQVMLDTLNGAGYPFYYDTYLWVAPAINGVILAGVSHSTFNGTEQDAGYYSLVAPVADGIAPLNSTGSSWSVMPQPCADVATLVIQSDKTGQADIQIGDLSGRQVSESMYGLNTGKNEIGVNTSALSSGIYMLTLTTNGQSETQKLVVRH